MAALGKDPYKIYDKGERFRLTTSYTLSTGEELPQGLVLVMHTCGNRNCLMTVPGHAKYERELLNVPRYHVDSDIFEWVGAEPKMALPKTLVKWYSQIRPHVGG